MKYKITTNYAPIILEVKVSSKTPQKLYFTVCDYANRKLEFTQRFKTVTGEETLFVRMPDSPEVSVVDVYKKNGKDIIQDDGTFKIESVKKIALERKLDLNDIGNSEIRSFIDFAKRFCFNLDNLPTGKYYESKDGMFTILFSDTILYQNGKEMTTPARISRTTGIIQVSKKAFLKMTYPMRLAILLHEMSHFYLNEKIDDEMEADLNGLLLYLGLGYPRIEAHEAWLGTFIDRPTELNKKRYDLIKKFINDFESMNLVIE